MTEFSSEYDLSGRSVAILATDGFEASELLEPLEALESARVKTNVISLPETRGAIRGETRGDQGEEVEVDATVDEVAADSFDALLLPGGRANVDRLRSNEDAVSFVRDFIATGRPLAAICHGPWLIAEAGEAEGRTLTSYPSIRADLERAGAEWLDEPVVVDGGLVTSRTPADLSAFIAEMLEQISLTVEVEPSP